METLDPLERELAKLTPFIAAYSDEIVHLVRRKASTRSGPIRPPVPIQIVQLVQGKSSTCSGAKNPVVLKGPGWPGRSEATHGMGSCPLVNGSLRSLFHLPHRLPLQAYSV